MESAVAQASIHTRSNLTAEAFMVALALGMFGSSVSRDELRGYTQQDFPSEEGVLGNEEKEM